MIRKLAIAIIIGLTSQVAFAQLHEKEKLDRYFDTLAVNNKFMGSVAIAQNGKLLYTKAVGYAAIENKVKATPQTKYRIGSISKSFTSVLVFLAIEEGKLDLDQTIEHYFPTIPHTDKITISHLLNHRSGIHNFTDDEVYSTYNTQPKTEAEMLHIIAEGGSDFQPDSKAAYSNSNYVLLTYILEKTYKKPYSILLKEKITDPIGLKHTYLGAEIDVNKQEAQSYKSLSNGERAEETAISIPLGAGGIVSTPTELTTFISALFSGKLVAEQSLETMKTIRDNYGMGLFQMPFYDKYGFGHSGGIDGFSSLYSYFPEDKLAFALTSNVPGYNNNDIAIAVLSAAYDKPFDLPKLAAYEVTEEELQQYLGTYSSEQVPLKITISKKGTTLIAQATGQASFPLHATEEHVFRFDQAGIVLTFNPSENIMELRQGGGVMIFQRDGDDTP